MTGVGICIRRSLEVNPLREPVLRAVIEHLQFPRGSYGLDAGCGIGLQALLLADAVGPEGHITGIDRDSESLAFGNESVVKAGYSNRITLCEGDAGNLPFDDNAFDWAWSADCIGYPLGESTPYLKELVRVVRPGGIVAILAYSSQQLLPGYPVLEARLNATCSAYLPYIGGKEPELMFLRAMRWFRRAGLEEVAARTFVGDVQAPLGSGERDALTSLFEMLWGERQPEASAEDWKEYRRLCDPKSPDFILDIPEYYAFFTYSMFRGRAPLRGKE